MRAETAFVLSVFMIDCFHAFYEYNKPSRLTSTLSDMFSNVASFLSKVSNIRKLNRQSTRKILKLSSGQNDAFKVMPGSSPEKGKHY